MKKKCPCEHENIGCEEVCGDPHDGSESTETPYSVQIVSEERYRSRPEVNMTDDMVRVVMTMPVWKLRELKRAL